ncbi:hypothetical protein WJX81_005428 [Elliptochloris bilobata]|uniref:beta-fructofuranosidase n=1 Tax=Elliptochloris bilobata TaxID=381761 RepID=A0AAW1S1X7_9CHLO
MDSHILPQQFVQTGATLPVGTRAKLGRSWALDPDKPWFHVMPRDGWLNDPNGPIFYKGRYHIFYQHVVGSSEWRWEMCWGHASSADLVTWRHEPLAMEPTPHGYDAAGCWSGCSAIDERGVPTLLYTGVRLRNSPGCGPMPPHAAYDLGLEMIECQCAAVCDPGCDNLTTWTKVEEPMVPLPPRGDLAGFRDPFIFARDGGGRPWKMLLGSGMPGRGGTLLVYHAPTLTSGWEYKGELPQGRSRPCGDWDMGAIADGAARGGLAEGGEGAAAMGVHVLCVSPYPHSTPCRPTNPCLYWLGALTPDDKFPMEQAHGPEQLDLGDVLYAPNAFVDSRNRVLMLAWLQELRGGGASCGFDYAGCLSLPRVLTLQGARLHQAPAPELAGLRQGKAFQSQHMELKAEQATPIERVRGPSLEVALTLRRGTARCAGVLLRAWLQQGPSGGAPSAAAVVVDWQRSVLEVVYPTVLHADTLAFDWDAPHRRIGGALAPPPVDGDGSVALRIFVDHSAVEVFTGAGQALATRVYRRAMPSGSDPGMFLLAGGGTACADDVSVYELGSIWEHLEDRPLKAHEPAEE